MKIYNTQSRKLEDFIPIKEKHLKMYVCGPTVYNLIHLGNARPIVFFDVVARYFDYIGYKVEYVQNFTDVDDKIIAKASEMNISSLEVSKMYIDEFSKDTNRLNLYKNILRPKVSDNIKEIEEMILLLINKGFAYSVNNDVFFDISQFKNYGKISNQKIEELSIGKRVEINESKKSPLDFALWKAKKEGEISWKTTFSEGRPGWHIECSALIKKYLGNTIDIHGGGRDLIFPHHENENAQSCCANNEKLSNYWMHNELITINNSKMSKSLNNFILLRDLLNSYSSDVIKLFILNTHYRKPLNFSFEEIDAIKAMYYNLLNNYEYIKSKMKKNTNENQVKELSYLEKDFIEAMENDFNTSKAISTIIQRVKLMVNLVDKNINVFYHYNLLNKHMKDVLGLSLERENMQDIQEIIDLLIELRKQARDNKDYETADKIRNVLNKYNIKIKDKK